MKPLKFRLYPVAFVLLHFSFLHGQTPGGISTNSTLWLKGNYSAAKMTFSSTNVVNGWIDEKSTYSLTQTTVTKQPLWYNGSSAGSSSDSLNYNAHVKFNLAAVPNTDLLANSNTATNLLGNAGTIIMVLNDDNGFRTALTYYSNTLFRYQVKQTFRTQTSDGVSIAPPASALSYTSDFGSAIYNSPARNARIVVSRGFGSTLAGRRNGTTMPINNNGVTGFVPGINAGINLGGNPAVVATHEPYDGRFGELILYNTTLPDADIQKIETYLALKYGITLNPAGLDATNGYVSSAGTSIYSRGTTGTTYWNTIGGVIGLGRDANSGLIQKQSHTYDDSVRVFISTLAATNAANTGTITDNLDFLMMGGTNGRLMEAAATAAEKPAGVTVRMDREWKLINTSFNQPFTIHIKPAAGASSFFTGGGTLRLMVDTDGDFTNSTLIPNGFFGINIAYSSGIITVRIDPAFSGSPFLVDGTPRYITIAANNGGLANDFLSFNSAKADIGVVLNWQVRKETTADRFEVEKSTDLLNWNVIAIEKSKAAIGDTAYYQYTDYTPLLSTVYYRIKEIDINGKMIYSEVHKITPQQKEVTIQVFPNPSTDRITVGWTGFKKPQQIKIINSNGASQQVPGIIHDYQALLNITSLPKGVYMIALVNGNETLYTKFYKN